MPFIFSEFHYFSIMTLNSLRLKFGFYLTSIMLVGVIHAQTYYAQAKFFGETHGLNISMGVSSIFQDRQGLLWFSTRDGLFRFNGTEFHQYKHSAANPNSLPSNEVNFCYQDIDNVYWIGVSGKGLYTFDEKLDRFIPWKNKNTQEIDLSNQTNLLCPFEDNKGVLWMSAATLGLVRINKKENTATLFNICDNPYPLDLYRSCRWVHHAIENKDGSFWLTSNDGLIHFDPVTGHFKISRLGDELTNIMRDGDGNLWISTWGGGLKLFDPDSQTFTSYLWRERKEGTTNIINAIAEKDKDHLWISSVDAGLMVFDKIEHTFQPVVAQTEEKKALVNAGPLLRDRENNVWVVCNKELVRINSSDIFNFVDFSNPALKQAKAGTCAFHIPSDSLVFIGTTYTREGLETFNLKNHKLAWIPLKNNGQSENVNDIYQSFDGVIWIATDEGVFQLNRKTFVAKKFNSPDPHYRESFEHAFIKISEDAQHRIWFATRRFGLFMLDRDSPEIIHYSSDSIGAHHLPYDHINDMKIDKHGNKWLALHAYLPSQPGLMCLTHDGNVVSYLERFTREIVYQLIVTTDGDIWVSTAQNGLFRIKQPLTKNEMIIQYTEDEGLSGNRTYGLTEDGQKNIWVATSTGLSVFSNKKFYTFSRNEGLSSNFIEASPYFDGENIYLLYADAMQYFRPDSLLRQHRKPGKISIESITINQHPITNIFDVQKLSLHYFENNLSFRFSAFDLAQGDQLQYEYRLLGSDTNWINIGGNRQLFFSNLAPGSYTLSIRAKDHYGNIGSQEWSMPIHVRAPFWKTAWFYILCTALLATMIYVVYRIRIKRVIAEQKLRNKIARDLHDDIGSSLSGIKLFTTMANDKLKLEKSEAAPIIERIGERSEKMMEAMSDIVWSINPANDSIEKMLVRMKQYAAEMMEPRNIHFEFSVNEKILKAKLNSDSRKDVYLVFKESINNAVKHAEATEVKIDLDVVGKKLLLTIKDNGKGFDPLLTTGNGNGLENFKQRAKNLNATINIGSQPGSGTSVTLLMPIT
jgi:ligand-binding sensor domain-containing protein/signal transduction histidine kinase